MSRHGRQTAVGDPIITMVEVAGRMPGMSGCDRTRLDARALRRGRCAVSPLPLIVILSIIWLMVVVLAGVIGKARSGRGRRGCKEKDRGDPYAGPRRFNYLHTRWQVSPRRWA